MDLNSERAERWGRRVEEKLGRKGTIAVGVALSIVFMAIGGPILLASAAGHLVAFLAFVAILVGPAVWVLADARKRGLENAFLWGLFALPTNVIGAIVYILVRNERRAAKPCATCGRPVASNHAACPYCGAVASSAKRSCGRCHNELEVEWRFCPYCRTEVGAAAPSA